MTTILPETLAIDIDRWNAGMTIDTFVETIDVNQEATRRRLQDVRLSDQDRAAFAALVSPVYVVVLTEPWCGDSLMNLPILARIAEAAPDMQVRIFLRSQEPELTAAYQARNIKNIPVFTFFDADFHELGTWVERSQAAHQRIATWQQTHPELAEIRNATDLTPEEKQIRFKPILHVLRIEMEEWYHEDLQDATVSELRALLQPSAV